jgi:mannose-6-phosphate isomerase-like protein (cupin superfamily)
MSRGYVVNIEKETRKNRDFRRVLHTAEHSQLVVMALSPGEEIGMEVHELDQFIRFEEGSATVVLDGEKHEVGEDWAVVIPAGTRHNVINASESEDLKLYTIYSPPQHPAETVHSTKADADAAERHHAS